MQSSQLNPDLTSRAKNDGIAPTTLAVQITALQQELKKLEKEEKTLEDYRTELKAKIKRQSAPLRPAASATPSASIKEFEKLRELENNFRIKQQPLLHKLRSLTLQNNLTVAKTPAFERIIIGAGVAGTSVYAALPESVQHEQNNGLPSIITLNDSAAPQQFKRDGHTLMGQPACIQTPQILSSHSEDFALPPDPILNPYDYVLADDFSRSLLETQNDLEMPIVDAKSNDIESKGTATENTAAKWEHPDCKHRIAVEMNGEKTYLYTKAIDLCTGPGPTRKLETDQINSDLEKELVATGQLVYGQDTGDAKLSKDVVFYGGGARSATIIADLLAKGQKEARIQSWVARSSDDLDLTKNLSRMFKEAYESKNVPRALGTLAKVSKSGHKLVLEFSAPKKEGNHSNLAGSTITCDQLVVSIGQDSRFIARNFRNFVPAVYEDINTHKQYEKDDETLRLPIGTHSPDGSIVVWGAAGAVGTGLSKKDSEEYLAEGTLHGRTLPGESTAGPAIYRSTFANREFTRYLQRRGMFPQAKGDEVNAYHYNLPDINQATREELMTIFSLSSATESDCKRYTEEVITLRASNPIGIQKQEDIESLPLNIQQALMSAYWRIVPKQNTAALADEYTARFFGATMSRDPYEPVFVSRAEHTAETEQTKAATLASGITLAA
jgi:hypothetical protein